jgi:hypothetical protein
MKNVGNFGGAELPLRPNFFPSPPGQIMGGAAAPPHLENFQDFSLAYITKVVLLG